MIGFLAVLLWLALRRERRLADSDPQREPLLGVISAFATERLYESWHADSPTKDSDGII